MRRVIQLLAPMLLVAASAHAQATVDTRSETITETSTPPRFELWLGGQIGAPFGFVKISEFDRSGDKLRLHNDLNIDTFEVAEIGAAAHLTDRDVLRGCFSYTFLYGSVTLPADRAFNGASSRAAPIFRLVPSSPA